MFHPLPSLLLPLFLFSPVLLSSKPSTLPKPLPSLQTIVFESNPWVILEKYCSIPCQSRIQAIGVLGLLFFKHRHQNVRLLIDALEDAMGKGNVHFNGLLNEPFEEVATKKGEAIETRRRSVYEAMTRKRSGKVETLMNEVLAHSEPPISTSLQLAVQLAMMREIGKNAEQDVQLGRKPRRAPHPATLVRITQVLLVPQLEPFINSRCIEHFLLVSSELNTFQHLCENFAYVSDSVSKLLLNDVHPRLSQAHLQFLNQQPFLRPEKVQMLVDYESKEGEKLPQYLVRMKEEQDRRLILMDSIFVSLCPGLNLKPIHLSANVSTPKMMQVEITENLKLSVTARHPTHHSLLLHFDTAAQKFSLLGDHEEVSLKHKDFIIASMQSKLHVLPTLAKMLEKEGVDDPLFLYLVRKYDLTVFMVDAPFELEEDVSLH